MTVHALHHMTTVIGTQTILTNKGKITLTKQHQGKNEEYNKQTRGHLEQVGMLAHWKRRYSKYINGMTTPCPENKK
jgi:hypothetical protein